MFQLYIGLNTRPRHWTGSHGILKIFQAQASWLFPASILDLRSGRAVEFRDQRHPRPKRRSLLPSVWSSVPDDMPVTNVQHSPAQGQCQADGAAGNTLPPPTGNSQQAQGIDSDIEVYFDYKIHIFNNE